MLRIRAPLPPFPLVSMDVSPTPPAPAVSLPAPAVTLYERPGGSAAGTTVVFEDIDAAPCHRGHSEPLAQLSPMKRDVVEC